MRTRSGTAESGDGFKGKCSPDQSDRTTGGRRIKFPKFQKFFGGRSPPAENIATTDGRPSPREDEPPKVTRTFEQNLEDLHLSDASQLLIEREDDLFLAITEAEPLRGWEDEVNKLAANHKALEGPILQALSLSLSPQDISSEALTSAVKAVCQEEEQDQRWAQRSRTPPQWRPSGWRNRHDLALRVLVEERLDNPSTPPADQVRHSSIQADVCSMGRQLKEDLLTVVERVKGCYPPEMDICNFYAKLYHQTLSTRLRKIADFGLGDQDCTFLLRLVNEFYPEILQKPQITANINTKALGKLLPEDLLKPLEEQYLNKHQAELTKYIDRVLEGARQMWLNGEEPKNEDGCYVSPVAIDIIQFINGAVTSAETVLADQHKAQTITNHLKELLQRYKSFQEEVTRQNKANSAPIIKANLDCIEHFRDFLITKSQLFPGDVQERCLSVLNEMKQAAHAYLLTPVHIDLKPQYRKMGTSDWLKGLSFEKLQDRLKDKIQHLQGSGLHGHQGLMSQFHVEVTAEYVKRLLKGEVKLKDRQQQEKAYLTVKDNAEKLHSLFMQMGSQEVWLRDVLIRIAEVLKLQDLAAIQVHVALLGTDYPDLSEKHVTSLLKLKTNLTKANRRTVKETLMETVKEASVEGTRPFFCRVQVK
ncbi:tumor necrosis factor alpha-induced protein 2 isoform X2 [Sphaeramia orbicularis]|nr:tumor necrosis factor alpha-induced protein 2-like isoform X2 [Sphaeramia orbicularis]